MKYFKPLFIVLAVFFSNNICSQTFKEILNYYDNSDQPKEVIFKDEDLRKIKYIKHYEDGSVAELYNYDPYTQKKDGVFEENISIGSNFNVSNVGSYNQGVLNCPNYNQISSNSVTVGQIKNGYPQGKHYVYLFWEKSKTVSTKAYSYGQTLYFDHNYGTGEYSWKKSHDLNFNENGLLDCEFEFGYNDKTLLNYKNGKLISYLRKENGDTKDSIFLNSKIIKLNGEYQKRKNREAFCMYAYFKQPFNFRFEFEKQEYNSSKYNNLNIEYFSSKPDNILTFKEFVNSDQLGFKIWETMGPLLSDHIHIDFKNPFLSLNDKGVFTTDYFSFYNSIFVNEVDPKRKMSNAEFYEVLSYVVSKYVEKCYSNPSIIMQKSNEIDKSIHGAYAYAAGNESTSFTFNHNINQDARSYFKEIGMTFWPCDPEYDCCNIPSIGPAILNLLNLKGIPINDIYLTSKDQKYAVSLKSHFEKVENDKKKKALAKKKAIAKEKSEKEECMKNLENHILKINTIEGITPINKKGQIPSKLDGNWQKFLKNENDIIAVACVLEIKKISNPIYGYDKSNFKNYFKQYRYDDKVYRDLNYMPYSWIIQTGFSNNCATYFLPWANSSMLTKLFSKDSNEDSISGANAGKIIESNNWGTIIK